MKKFLFSFLFIIASLLSGEGFSAETLIKTLDGYTPIEKIEVGQIIESFDCENNEITTNSVVAKYSYTAKKYLVFKLENEEIICSCNQKFYLSILDKWFKAKELLSNKVIKNCFCHEYKIIDIIEIEKTKELYTLTVNPHHNFFVTQSNISAHNFGITLVWIFGEGVALGETVSITGCSIAAAFTAGILGTFLNNFRNDQDPPPPPSSSTPPNSSNHHINSPKPPDDEKDPETAHNMEEVLRKTALGKSIKDKLQKTNKIVQNQRVYKVTKKVPEFDLKKGDQIYLDGKHKDHLEIFGKDNIFKRVIDFAGKKIENKTNRGAGRTLD